MKGQAGLSRIIYLISQDKQGEGEPHPVRINLEASGINPKFVSSLAPSENVLCIAMEVDVEVFIGSLFICLPYSMIEPFRNATLTTEREKKKVKINHQECYSSRGRTITTG